MPVAEFSSSARLESWFGTFANQSHCVWLDGLGNSATAEWSILAANPEEVREGPGDDLLGWLAEWESRLRRQEPVKVPFVGGLIGQLDYEPRLPGYPPVMRPRLSGWVGLYERALVGHHPTGRVFAVMGAWVADAETELARWTKALRSTELQGAFKEVCSTRPESDQSAENYREGVRRARDWIASGDIYQANLSQRFSCELERGGPTDLYRMLRRENPAPYSAYLDCGRRKILSSSPELFLAVDAERGVTTRPIKGTRPRSADPVEDRLLAQALLSNEKERAELLMIVDMERNDLGRVCETASIRADTRFFLESFASVHHMVGEVRGKLRPSADLADLFTAAFPGGSITGAPKQRAMEIIGELEISPRGAYCGTIGFLSAGGVSRWNIAIRTMEVTGSRVEFGVGAGIVWDSDPENEYEETLHKARKMITSLGWSLEKGICKKL